MSERRIMAARITESRTMWDPPPVVWVRYEGDESEVRLFAYYPDEISFTADEFIGLTESQALHLKYERDKKYLQS